MRMKVVWISLEGLSLLMLAYRLFGIILILGIHPFAKWKVEEMGSFSSKITSNIEIKE